MSSGCDFVNPPQQAPTNDAGAALLPPEKGGNSADELAYRLRQQELLAAFGLFACQRRDDLETVLFEATRVCAEGLQTKLCKVLQATGDPVQRLLVRAGVGWAAGVIGRATIGADLASPAGYALKTGRPVISNHLGNEGRFRTPSLLAEHGVRRAINVLIPDGDQPFGVLEADSPSDGRFTNHDVAFMQALANLLGAAIQWHDAERRIADSERSFRGTFEQAAVGVAHVGTGGEWLRVNDRLCAIVGFSRQELLDRTFQQITHPDDLASDLARVRALLAGETTTYSMEKRYIRKDKACVWVNLTVSLMRDDTGRPLYFISVIEDINSRKRAEAALQELNATLEQRVVARTQDLQQANERLRREITERERAQSTLRHAQKMKAVGELTSGIAHDFNNVLTAIGGGIDLALRSEGERARSRLVLARTAVERGAKLARDLLAFSRSAPLQQEVIDLRDRIEAMRDMLDRSLGDQVRVVADLAADIWTVRVDANQFELSILNAAVNARDAMDGAGTFRVVARNVTIPPGHDAELNGDFVELAFADTGRGMPPEVIERAFEPFFTTKQRGDGTGLGLAQIYAFAIQSGGTARIDSAPGQGTTIRLLLPACVVIASPESTG